MKCIGLKKWICVIIALCSIISGMGLDSRQADSFFRCAKESSTVCTISAPSDVTPDQDMCREEALGVMDVKGSIRAAGRMDEKSGLKAHILFLKAESPLQKSIVKVELLHAETTVEFNRSNEVIIAYIHRQDGEKA